MMYEGSDSMMGFRMMSKYYETTYVTQPILAQIGRTGGVFPGMNGGRHGYELGSFCSFGRKQIEATWLYLINVKELFE
jgi:hypothetical protein